MDWQTILFGTGAVGCLVTFFFVLCLAKRPAKISNMAIIFLATTFLTFLGLVVAAPFIHFEQSFSSGAADDK